MIIFNNRLNGPMEYDKFAINITNFCMLVEDMINGEKGAGCNLNTLIEIRQQVNNVFNAATKNAEKVLAKEISYI